jgi:RNA polymerase sigma factor (TIGR02999 family)
MRENQEQPLKGAAITEAPRTTPRASQAGCADPEALDHLLPQVYTELRRIARRELCRESPGHTFDSGALVHEAYLKLAGRPGVAWQDRTQFFAIAARTMRTILIDYARARSAVKRGGGAKLLPLKEAALVVSDGSLDDLLALDEALDRLARIDEQASRVVEQRYFAGLTLPEIARALQLSLATTERRWAFAKAWLQLELREAG